MVKSVSCCCVRGSRLFTDLVTYHMALQLALYYVPSHASACYFLIRHGGVISPHFNWPTGDSTDSQDLSATGRSRWIALAVIYY